MGGRAPGLPVEAPGAEPRIRLAAAVAQAGIADLREVARLRLSGGAGARFVGGSPGKVPQRYALASPIERLPLGVPQLLVHGDADDVCPWRSLGGTRRAPPRQAINARSSSCLESAIWSTSTRTARPGGRP